MLLFTLESIKDFLLCLIGVPLFIIGFCIFLVVAFTFTASAVVTGILLFTAGYPIIICVFANLLTIVLASLFWGAVNYLESAGYDI